TDISFPNLSAVPLIECVLKMFKGDLAALTPIDAYNIKADVFMPVDLIDKIISCPNDQLPLFVIHKLLGIAEAGPTPELDLHKDLNSTMLHNQVNFRMLVAIIGAHEFIALGL